MPERDRLRPLVVLVLAILAAVSLAAVFLTGRAAWRPSVTLLTRGTGPVDQTTSGFADEVRAGGTKSAETAKEKIPVYLVGAVARPGIYEVVPGTYLYELVELAGGLTPQAAADRINLVFCIRDSRLIRIISMEEAAGISIADGGSSGIVEADPDSQGKVNINTADETLLETLPGVGPSTAHAIVSFRQANGPFATIEEIMNVPGIKQSRFDALKDAIMT
jgi:competence protein ComEA